MHFEVGSEVQVDSVEGVWRARIVHHHLTHDGQTTGITRIQVTDPGNSRFHTGDVLDVGTLTLWPIR